MGDAHAAQLGAQPEPGRPLTGATMFVPVLEPTTILLSHPLNRFWAQNPPNLDQDLLAAVVGGVELSSRVKC